jgi:hypothetical protein
MGLLRVWAPSPRDTGRAMSQEMLLAEPIDRAPLNMQGE